MCVQCIYTATREESTSAILNNNTHFETRFNLLLTNKLHKKPDQNVPYDGGFTFLKVVLIFLTVFSDRNCFHAENCCQSAADFRTFEPVEIRASLDKKNSAKQEVFGDKYNAKSELCTIPPAIILCFGCCLLLRKLGHRPPDSTSF